MRAAISGDSNAYHRFLEAVTPYLRALSYRQCERFGAPRADAEDIVQEALLAIHTKRNTWDPSRPIGPWISTIVRNKMFDVLRRRGWQASISIEDIMDIVESEPPTDGTDQQDLERMLGQLTDKQREIVQSISVNGLNVRETAQRLRMTEGAVRVALHRAVKALAAFYRRDFA